MDIISTILENAVNIIDFGFIIWCIVLLYLSLKKCFLKGKKGSVRLLLITVFTNPLVLYFVSLYAMIIPIVVILLIFNLGNYANTNSGILLIIQIISGSIIYMLLTFLFSRLVGKWLKVPNKSLVTFVYLMFGVFFSVMIRGYRNETLETSLPAFILSIASTTILFIASWFLYHFVIKALSGLTDKKREVNAKIFLIPPAIFNLTYVSLAFTNLDLSFESITIVYIFSTIITFLFIWAFYVIIKNINATNEAIEAKDEVKALSVEVMEALAHTIDAKDKYTNGHSVRVAKYSRMIAEKMGLEAQTCENIYYMGLLHDIGKIGVPNEIINKPAKLTDTEYDIIKTHPVIGYDILTEIKSNPELAKGARWHHERYDGRGYPDKIVGEAIPLEARIIAVADSYDAMTSNRSYRKYLPQEAVRAEIEKNIGTQFDPVAAKMMLRIIDDDTEYVLHEM